MWFDFFDNPHAISNVYNDTSSLETMSLLSMNMGFNNSNISLQCQLPKFPDKPPKKWDKNYNCASIELKFTGIANLEIEGWSSVNIFSLNIEKVSEEYYFLFKAEGREFKMQFLYEIGQITGLEGYIGGAEE